MLAFKQLCFYKTVFAEQTNREACAARFEMFLRLFTQPCSVVRLYQTVFAEQTNREALVLTIGKLRTSEIDDALRI